MADLVERLIATSQISPTAVRWTRQDCEALEQASVLNFRYELVEGFINRMGQNIGHAGIVRRLLVWLFAAFGAEFVLTQLSIDVRSGDNPTSEPEPDVTVLTRRDSELGGNPTPVDLRLVIEASDTTLAYDLTTKARLYARAGIPEYWVVSLPERKLYVHQGPDGGAYREVSALAEGEFAAPLGAPDKAVTVASLLPPEAVV